MHNRNLREEEENYAKNNNKENDANKENVNNNNVVNVKGQREVLNENKNSENNQNKNKNNKLLERLNKGRQAGIQKLKEEEAERDKGRLIIKEKARKLEEGLKLKDKYSEYDARIKFEIPPMHGHGNPACRCASVLKGEIKPYECPCFGKVCTPEHAVGACMVSDEGACSAWYLYGGLDLK